MANSLPQAPSVTLRGTRPGTPAGRLFHEQIGSPARLRKAPVPHPGFDHVGVLTDGGRWTDRDDVHGAGLCRDFDSRWRRRASVELHGHRPLVCGLAAMKERRPTVRSTKPMNLLVVDPDIELAPVVSLKASGATPWKSALDDDRDLTRLARATSKMSRQSTQSPPRQSDHLPPCRLARAAANIERPFGRSARLDDVDHFGRSGASWLVRGELPPSE